MISYFVLGCAVSIQRDVFSSGGYPVVPISFIK